MRIFITTEVNPKFPITLLQLSTKFTNEPPQGMKAGIRRTYASVTQEQVSFCYRFVDEDIVKLSYTISKTSLKSKSIVARLEILIDICPMRHLIYVNNFLFKRLTICKMGAFCF